MRRNEKEIESRHKIDEIIAAAEVCRLALAMDNKPYLIPVSFGYDGKCLYVHTATSGKKIDYLKSNNQVCFEFDDQVKTIDDDVVACKWTAAYRSVIGFGKMLLVENLDDRIYAINQIMLHYSKKEWDFNEKMLLGVKLWKIEIDEITGKQSGY